MDPDGRGRTIMVPMRRSWILITLFAAACGSSTPPPPPSTGSGSSNSGSITGRERIGWDQPAAGSEELATFRYAIYVDGARSEIVDPSCSGSAGASGFACTGRLPQMSSGAHTLEIATFSSVNPGSGESPKSAPLQVVVSAMLASDTAPATDWQSGEIGPTRDGVRLRVDKVTDGLDRPTDAAFAPDGRLLISERVGRIRVVSDGVLQPNDALLLPEDDEGVPQAALSLAFDPDFARTRFVFVVHTAESADGPMIQLSRYREFRGRLAERAVLFQSPASDPLDRSAVVRFGPDGRLYLVVSGTDPGGRLFRLNTDGTMPRDQSGTTPAIATGVTGARGLAWAVRSGVLWIVDDDSQQGHLSGVSLSPPPVQAIIRGRTTLRPGVASLAIYTGDAIPEMKNEALIVSAEAYLLRIRFADDDPTEVVRAERLLQDRVGPLRVVTVGPNGAIYFLTDTAVGKLSRVQ
jgi:aldose sugar dehydrogenase